MLSLQDILQVLVSSSFLKDLFDLLKQIRESVTEQRLQGIYEVLDQQRTVTIHDPQGRVATVDTIQHLRFRQNYVTAITEYAWGGVWTRPGLDRRSRSIVTLTALVARGHHEELAMHLRAALRNGLSVEEVKG